MKPFIKAVGFFLFSASLYAQTYVNLMVPYFEETMKDVYFVTEQTGWTCGGKGFIYKTTNGGTSWSKLNSGTTKDIQKVFFINETTGWAATVNGSVLKTVNGGTNWTEYIFGSQRPAIVFAYADGLIFTDQNTGFIIAGQLKNFFLFKTTDGGVNWSVKDSLFSTDLTVRWNDFDFSGPKGVMISSKKNFHKFSTNLGDTWTLSTPIVDNFFGIQRGVKWVNSTTAVSVGEGNEFNGLPISIYKTTDGGQTWVKKNSSVITNFDRPKDLHFKNSTEGIAVGSNGFTKAFVLKTSDAGETWSTSAANYSFGLQAVTGVNNTVFAMGTGSHFLRSTDFGTTWSNFPFATPTSIYNIWGTAEKVFVLNRSGDFFVSNDGTGRTWQYLSNTGQNDAYSGHFFNSTTGVVLKENKHIVKTTDGGVTWRNVLDPVPYNARNRVGGMAFGSAETGYAWFSQNDYGEYYIYKTTNAGDSWTQVYGGGGPGYISGDIVAFDANTAVALGPNRWALRTTNGGATWDSAKTLGFPAGFDGKDFEDVALLSDTKAIAIGNQFICVTTDKGANWNYVNHNLNGIDSAFYTIAFKDQNTGYIGQYNGIIFKTTNSGTSWSADSTLKDKHILFASGFNKDKRLLLGTANGYILGDADITGVEDNNNIIVAKDFSLGQNYPNPFNPATTIDFSIPENNVFTELKVYDVLGRQVASLVNEIKQAGSYSVSFDASALTSGVYFYQLKAGAFSQSRKLLLIK